MIWLLMALLSGPAQANEHSVAVSADVSVSALDRKQARRLFTGQAVWDDGREVKLILPPIESEAMAWLSTEILGISPTIYHRYLLEKAYRAGRAPPPVAASIEEIQQAAVAMDAVLTVLPLPVGDGFQVVRIN